jgi:hypothetical protein
MPSLLDVYESLNWVFFDSSALNAAAHIPTERLLYLEFHGGERYRYFNFPPEQYQNFLAAESKGTYFGQHIRDRFLFERLAYTPRAGG